ncbi:MAG: cysteine desulfurase [Clostridiales bacterium]|nr:cysteine desulfurase [Clostridiales bacterium]
MIYLDNAATTRVFDIAADAARKTMLEQFHNPNATYRSGVEANDRIEQARKSIATAIGAEPNEIIFTSCATEANNWVFSCGIKNKKGNIVISAGEHSSVYETAMALKSRGADVRMAPLTKDGYVDESALLNLVDENTALVSLIHVSNETGVVNDIKRLSSAIHHKSPKTLIHSDGVQGLLKIGTRLDDLGVDYYTASAHKLGAPKGIGLAYIRNGLNIAPLIYGGGQERGLRSGTQNTPYIAAFAAAVDEIKSFNANNCAQKIQALRQEVCDFFISNGCKIVGSGQNNGYIACVCIPGAKAEIVQNMAHDNGVIIGKGAACSGAKRGNRVLSAMGLSPKEIECCTRISLFINSNRDDTLHAAQIIMNEANKLRSNHVG